VLISKLQLNSLKPLCDDIGIHIESPTDYLSRTGCLLPNFPAEVLSQWFYDHNNVVEEYSWLNYPTLNFTLHSFTPKTMKLPCFWEHETVVQYRNYFLEGVVSQRMSRLSKYIRKHGSWPVPPLVIHNPKGKIKTPWGLQYSSPYELIEGHHRFAVLYALGFHCKGTHNIWLCSLPP